MIEYLKIVFQLNNYIPKLDVRMASDFIFKIKTLINCIIYFLIVCI